MRHKNQKPPILSEAQKIARC